jgi:hypothetical protein
MGNLEQTIQKHIAPSINKRVTVTCWSDRKRGAARESMLAQLTIDRRMVVTERGLESCGSPVPCTYHPPEPFLYEALLKYESLSIDQILRSENIMIRGLGMLDSRLGIRRLSKMNVKHECKLVRALFQFRCKAEGLEVAERPHSISVEKIEPRYTQVSTGPSREVQLERVLAQHKRRSDVTTALNQLKRDSEQSSAFTHPIVTQFLSSIKGKGKRADKLSSLRLLASKSRLVSEEYLAGVVELLNDQVGRAGYVGSWVVRSHNADKQFSSFARHLFAKYYVPEFMNSAWLNRNHLHQKWFKHIGSGKNIRTAPDLPVPLTKMMAHHFLTAPDTYTVDQAFRRAQALAAGADERMAYAVAHTRLEYDFTDNEFWLTVIGFFARNPMLDIVHVGPIVDFIWNQKYVDVVEFVDRGVAVNRGPAQPNFSMKGRTVNALLQQVQRWHRTLGAVGPVSGLTWGRSPIVEFEFTEGSAENKNMRIWRVSELLSAKALSAEGRALDHCVASYANSCYKGTASIWSLTLQTGGLPDKVLTIQVTTESKRIVQVRGKRNRGATDKEHEILQRWATKAGLRYDRAKSW